MEELWETIPDFPNYAVSNRGSVINRHTNGRKVATQNQQGIPSVLLSRDGEHFRRSVTVLVAKVFLPKPANKLYDTPINLDGNRLNNDVRNLMWRPRWFASKYHAQLKHETPFQYRLGIEILTTGEYFETVRECAIRHGLLEKELILAAWNNTIVPFIWSPVKLDE